MLTDRQKMIFKYIVDDYTKNGQPTGSKMLAEQLPIVVSSATIRNEMAVLAANNLIEKVHTSSGRVPSNKGYRFYIDNLISPIELDDRRKKSIHQRFNSHYQQIDEVVKQSAEILSNITDYTAITLTPEQSESQTLSHFQLTKINDNQVMLILVLGNGEIESHPFKTKEVIDDSELTRINNLVNDKLDGLTIPEVLESLKKEIPEALKQNLLTTDDVSDAMQFVISEAIKDHVFVSGQMNLLDSINNKADLKSLYEMFGKETGLSDLFSDTNKPVDVAIGSEIKNELLENYSVISGTYDVGNRGIGHIAVIGPKRMEYPKVLGLVEAIRTELKNTIDGL